MFRLAWAWRLARRLTSCPMVPRLVSDRCMTTRQWRCEIQLGKVKHGGIPAMEELFRESHGSAKRGRRMETEWERNDKKQRSEIKLYKYLWMYPRAISCWSYTFWPFSKCAKAELPNLGNGTPVGRIAEITADLPPFCFNSALGFRYFDVLSMSPS